MMPAERDALAVDIARRVRLLAVGTIKPEFFDHLRPGARWTYPIDGLANNSRAGLMMAAEVRAGALFLTFEWRSADGYPNTQTCRFEPEQAQ